MRLGKTTVAYFGSQVVASVSGFVATLAIVRLLGGDVLGVYAVAMAVTLWTDIPASAVGSAITKRVSEGTEKGAYFSAGLVLNVGFAFVGATLVAIGLVVLGGTSLPRGSALAELAPLWWLVGPLVAANALFVTIYDGLRGQKLVAQSGLLDAGERILRTAAQIGLILAGAALVGVVAGYVASLALATVLGIALFEIRPVRPTREHVRSILSYARYSWLGRLQTRSFAWMDTVVLAVFVPSLLIGIYEAAWTLASVLSLLSLSIKSTLFPEMSELSTEADYERIHHYLDEALAFTGLLMIPGLFGAAVVGDLVLRIYRPSFARGTLVLVVLVFARTVAEFGSQFLSVISAIDRPDVAFRISLGFIGVNLLVNVLLVWQFGWLGAAAATTLSAGVLLTASFYFVTDLIGRPSVPVGEIGRQVLGGCLMAGVLLALRPAVPVNPYASVGLVGVGAAVYAGSLLAVSSRFRTKVVGLFRSAPIEL